MMYHLVKGDHHLKSTLFRVNFKVIYIHGSSYSDELVMYPKPR